MLLPRHALRRVATLALALAPALALAGLPRAVWASEAGVVLTSTAPTIPSGRSLQLGDSISIPVGASIAVAVGRGTVIWLEGPYDGPVPAGDAMAPGLTARLIQAVSAHTRARSAGVFRTLGAPGEPAAGAAGTAGVATLDGEVASPWVVDVSVPHQAVCLTSDGQARLVRGAAKTFEGVAVETADGRTPGIELIGQEPATIPAELIETAQTLRVFSLADGAPLWQAPVRRLDATPETETGTLLADLFAAGCRTQAFRILDRLAAETSRQP